MATKEAGNDRKARRKLTHIDLEVTRQCNLNCRHCSAANKERGQPEMSVDQIKNVLIVAKSMGLQKVGLTGGEPFLNPEKLKTIADFIVHELCIPIHIHSNGTKISYQDAIWLKENNAEITIPVYGNTASIHEAVTKTKGSFSLTCLGLDRLIEAQANVCVYVVPMRQNLKAIEPLIKLVFAKGVRHIRVLSLMPTGRAESQFKKIDLTSLEKQQLNSQLIRLHKNLGLDIKVGFCTSQDFKGLKILDEHDKCSAAENRIHIDTFGNVFPCTASSGRIMFSAGNLQIVENNLRSLWKESPLLQFFRAFHENPPMRCLGCAKHGTCMSGCRVKMSYLYGDITAADPKCKGPYKKTNQSQLQKGAL